MFEARLVAIASLYPDPTQPRRTGFDDESLKPLCESIKRRGILQPICATSDGQGRYKIVFGERRYRAALAAGLLEVPVIPLDTLSEPDRLESQLVENLLRKDLCINDKANAVAQLVAQFPSQKEAADVLGITKGYMTQLLELANLRDDVKSLVDTGITKDATALAMLNQLAVKSPETAEQLIAQATETGKLPREAVKEAFKPFRKPRKRKDDDAQALTASATHGGANPKDEESPSAFGPVNDTATKMQQGEERPFVRSPSRRKLQQACRYLGISEDADLEDVLERLTDHFIHSMQQGQGQMKAA